MSLPSKLPEAHNSTFGKHTTLLTTSVCPNNYIHFDLIGLVVSNSLYPVAPSLSNRFISQSSMHPSVCPHSSVYVDSSQAMQLTSFLSSFSSRHSLFFFSPRLLVLVRQSKILNYFNNSIYLDNKH